MNHIVDFNIFIVLYGILIVYAGFKFYMNCFPNIKKKLLFTKRRKR